ncbi:hypothetical protein OFS03_06210 [Brachyspira hyodysenteriae]|nr:hypothetical protein [Brachyspira hyodysenteriae]MDA0062811.1 hypothetical protein [Brachyspira hyodysenteriae]
MSKINFLNLKYLQGFAPHPTSFVATGEARLRREAKRLYFILNLIFYLTCKKKLVLFSTNFILALSRSVPAAATFCGEKKLNKKIDKLKNFFSIYY